MTDASPDDSKIQIVESEGENKSYKYQFTYERATLYEYKFERQAVPDAKDPCFRCNKRVQRKEQVGVEELLFHKQCFRCRICGLPLSLQTYHRNPVNGSNDNEVYCKTHVGKTIGEIKGQQQLHITHNDSPNNNNDKYEIQIEGKSRQGPAAIKPTPSPRNSPRHSPHNHSPASSLASVTPRSMMMETPPSAWTTHSPHALDYSAANISYGSMKSFDHPKPILQSYSDFENMGIFEAQSFLEQRHKEEEERLQRFLLEEREKEMRRLDESIDIEKDRAASDLLGSLDQMTIQNNSRNLMYEKERIEEHFRRLRDERLKSVTDKTASEEKARSTKMLDRHCHEMMALIAEKERESNRDVLHDHSMKPPILPPETKKSSLYRTPAHFETLDKRAVDLSHRDYNTHTELVRDLTRDCHNELDKVRVIFRWVIAKDLNKNSVTEIVHPNATTTLLKGVKSGKETYHHLFKKLCCYAGIHCDIILGYSKGAGYKPGMRMEGATFRNSWTAVNIDGSWRLVNCTWAARHVTGHRDDLPQLFHKYDEFYFLTDPEDYIYQHYPDDPAWQLLEIPLPFSEFLNLPVVKSPFFNYGLRFYSNYGATLNTSTGMAEIRLIMPKILGFGSLLEPLDKSVGDARQMEGRTLLRLVKNDAIFTVSLPRPGYYYFSVYTGDYWHSECLESACSFLINCTQISSTASPSYPPVPFYGATPVMEKLGLTTEGGADPLIVCNSDYLEIKFKMIQDVKVTHTFQYYDVNDESVEDIDRYVFLRSRTDTAANYLVRCPKEGFYIFSLFAAGADSKGETTNLECAFRYLVICQEPSPSTAAFPKTFHKWQKCTLHEPISGDLMTNKRYNFKLDVPSAVEVFVVIGDFWNHLKRKVGFTWEGNIMTSKDDVAKIIARFQAGRDQSTFPQLLEYQLVEDVETEI
ncbi:hypothetical protein SNE40_002058 [Patella caerulea]|uniref:LIM zinc-binding domain-containing protein n=1 Tax=Patella caerulea TaxID=87958 RepID=A0AAN8KB40_PATCE